MQKQGGSPRTPSNKPSEILIQFYHLLYSWSTAYFFENIKSNTIGKAWIKKNWALLSRLHITTRVFILPVVSGDFFFSGCCSSIIRFKESCSTVYSANKKLWGAFWSSFMPDLDERSAFETRSFFISITASLVEYSSKHQKQNDII